MLLSNNSKPWGRLENLTNMVDLFFFVNALQQTSLAAKPYDCPMFVIMVNNMKISPKNLR
jgi:hypothetical protein